MTGLACAAGVAAPGDLAAAVFDLARLAQGRRPGAGLGLDWA